MIYNFFSNRGMITEDLVSKTIEYYSDNKIAYFKKAHVPVVQTEHGSVPVDKADVDFYGVYKGQYIAFEVKETQGTYFSVSQVQEHQLDALQNIKEHGGISFLMINFLTQSDGVWIIDIDRLMQLINNKVKRISINEVQAWGTNLAVEYPGIVNWLTTCVAL